MTKTYLGYHMAHEFDEFGGEIFFTSKVADIGGSLFVVSANRRRPNDKVEYSLEGKFLIVDAQSNDSGRHSKQKKKLTLKSLVRPVEPILLSASPSFDKEAFRDRFASGQGLTEIKSEQLSWATYFNSLLGGIESTDNRLETLLEDIAVLDMEVENTNPTERADMRMARIGQGKFRRNTIDCWGGIERCAVTGITIPALLNASHVVPWRDAPEKRLNGSNGVILAVHIDRLFDRLLIGFKESSVRDVYSIVHAPQLSDEWPTLAALGITDRTTLSLVDVKFAHKAKLEGNLRHHLDSVMRAK